uniref:C2H2-type domain-containing protein n=1 Tax=Megaviridae environmental sample TaxID=1737588 RepID=A0A5J6VM25_9VIRU|nr:MAG: hypothetical protein [Megaviridae environmental sample]
MACKNQLHIKKKYSCEACQYTTCSKKDFIKHISTKKHTKKWQTRVSNNKLYYDCNNCDYITCNLDDLNTHFNEQNHTNISICPKLSASTPTFMKEQNICDICGKQYKYTSGYYRHRKTCSVKKEEKLVKLLLDKTNENNNLCKKIMQLENNQTIINNTIINNKQFNINLFLNKECKNAMNLTDFINKIQLSLEDLIYTKDNGYIKGITNIFVKHLEDLKLTERPIHSISDKKSQQFYVKNNEGWECDKKDTKIDETIDSVAKKQINKIKVWQDNNPNWNNTDKGISDYMKIVKTLMGGNNDEEIMKNKHLIKKELTENVGLND